MFIAEKVGKEWTMDQAPQYAIDHVANSKKNIFEFDFLNSLSSKISNFFGISSESLFYIDLGISKHVFLFTRDANFLSRIPSFSFGYISKSFFAITKPNTRSPRNSIFSLLFILLKLL